MGHLEQVKMGYFEHLWFAWWTAAGLIVHGLLPDHLEHWASDRLCARQEEIAENCDDYSPFNTSNS